MTYYIECIHVALSPYLLQQEHALILHVRLNCTLLYLYHMISTASVCLVQVQQFSQTNFDLFTLCDGHARTAAQHRNIAGKICTSIQGISL